MTNYGGKALTMLNALAAAADATLELPVSAMDILSKTYFTETEDREMASLFGWYFPDDGAVDLYIEAILSYANYLGVDSLSVLAKVFFMQVHNAIRSKANRPWDFKKAARFANRCLRIVNHRFGFELDERPQLYYDESIAPSFRVDEIWRRQWLANDSVLK